MRDAVKRKCCPLCGGRIVVSLLFQTSHNYVITKNGKISKRFTRDGEHDMEAFFAICSNRGGCDAYWDMDSCSIDEDGCFWDEKYVDEEVADG